LSKDIYRFDMYWDANGVESMVAAFDRNVAAQSYSQCQAPVGTCIGIDLGGETYTGATFWFQADEVENNMQTPGITVSDMIRTNRTTAIYRLN
jgi:hypothetical protein